MSQQTTFRIVFAALFLFLFGVVGTYRRKALAGRRIDYADEGLVMLIALRLGGLFLWGFCLLYIIYPRPLGWSFIDVPSWLRWVGAAVVLVLIPFVVSSQRALGRKCVTDRHHT